MPNNEIQTEITQSLQPYFDGLYDSDVQKMRQIFHPGCILASAPDGKANIIGMDDYYARVVDRPSPCSLGQKRYDKILEIVASGEGAATAILRTARAPRLYTDFLSLLQIDGRWQIVSKTYSWTDLPEDDG